MKFIKEIAKFYFSVEGYCTTITAGGILGGTVGAGHGVFSHEYNPKKHMIENTVDLTFNVLLEAVGGAALGTVVVATLPLVVPAAVITGVRSLVNK